MKEFYVYILSNKYRGTLYVGITSNLIKRIWEHKSDLVEGFTKKYQTHQLVYFEKHQDAKTALNREKNLKAWKRNWKIELIEKNNSKWDDLFSEII